MKADQPQRATITSIEFSNYKAFPHFSLKLHSMNVLVGPNNCGKSTILGAFRALEIGLRRARARNPELVQGPQRKAYGYTLAKDILPISTENVHTDYAETKTTITFRLSNGNRLIFYFPEDGGSVLIPEPEGRNITSVSAFKSAYPITIAVVPILGPVEQEEEVLKVETVQRDLGTHRASRHFRNYWHHFPEGFDEFSQLVAGTWPGMEIERPERRGISSKLSMFCREKRITRELFWSGFGFQIWCQLLTHISRARDASILVVDEPEVYLHPDVQRQLLELLRTIGPDILLATHSSEIISDADPSEIALIDKTKRSAERLRDIEGVQHALSSIGSIHNISLTRLARNRRVLFVEGDQDFRILRRFAKLLGFEQLSSAVELTAVVSEGFGSWEKISSLGWGIEKTLGRTLRIAVLYDRDYFCIEEVQDRLTALRKSVDLAHVLMRKEIENYLLVPTPLCRALNDALREKESRDGVSAPKGETVEAILERVTASMKSEVQGQYVGKRTDYLRKTRTDTSTIASETIVHFDRKWSALETRLEIVPGKEVLKLLRDEVQRQYGVTLTDSRIISAFKKDEVPHDLVGTIRQLDSFRTLTASAPSPPE